MIFHVVCRFIVVLCDAESHVTLRIMMEAFVTPCRTYILDLGMILTFI